VTKESTYVETFINLIKHAGLIEKKGSQPALAVLESYIPWPVLQTKNQAALFLSTFDWVKTVATLRRDGANYLISTGVSPLHVNYGKDCHLFPIQILCTCRCGRTVAIPPSKFISYCHMPILHNHLFFLGKLSM
jgi:hypothetical protein